MQSLDLKEVDECLAKQETKVVANSGNDASPEGLVSFFSEVPVPLQAAMTTFIERHPNWDQYRLIQAALAGFLVQNGMDSRPVTRLYLDNMFCSKSFGQDL